MQSSIKIGTWNVNSLRIRLPHVLQWLETHQPDALCLQETKVEDGTFPADELAAAGWQAAYYGQKSYNGVAILSRKPLGDVTCGFATGYASNGQARLMAGTLHSALGDIRLISVYVPNGESLTSEKFAFKETFYAELLKEVQAETAVHRQLVLCGDFNIAADERDVVNATRAAKDVLFTPTERAWLQGLQENAKLHDAFRAIDDSAGVFSWFDYRSYGRTPNNGMRIDYLFTTPVLVPHIQAVHHHIEERAKQQPSDHVPVLLELSLQPKS